MFTLSYNGETIVFEGKRFLELKAMANDKNEILATQIIDYCKENGLIEDGPVKVEIHPVEKAK